MVQARISGKKTGVQASIKKLAPHALFVHCHCYLLQLACVELNVYVTLTAHWKFFHYSPKRVESQNGLKSASSSRVEDCQSFRYTLAGI